MRIVCISDTHELHRELEVPRGDILIHAGDFTMFSGRPAMIRDFNKWLGELPHPHKIVIFGNHEFAFEKNEKLRHTITNATVLMNEAAEVAGFTVWGSPITPLYGVAYGRSSAADREAIYKQIPEKIDILVTHGPPYGVLDTADGSRAGCTELRKAVVRVRPRLHVFGHIHSGYGTFATKSTMFVNAALLGKFGALDKQPIVLEIADR